MAVRRPLTLGWIIGLFAMAAAPFQADPETGEKGKLVASPEPGWPQWRGPRRDGISDEKGLFQSWPEGGPKVHWIASGIGRGYSQPIIARGSLFITGDVDGGLHVFALDLSGKLKWRATNGRSWQGESPGARASCAFDDGRLYHLNAHGRLACLEAETGRELWAVDVLDRFESRNITWALSESPLVDASKVIVTPGGKKGAMSALQKKTGQTLWVSEPILYDRIEAPAGKVADGPGYASAILFGLGGRRQIVNCSARHLFGVDAETGRLLWKRPMATTYEVLAITPVLCGDSIFYSAPFGPDGRLFRLRAKGPEVQAEEVWSSELDNSHGGVVLVGDTLFGSGYHRVKGWGVVDARTGQVLQRMRDFAMGSLIWADGRFYCLSQDGVMALVQADRQGLSIVSRFRLTEDRKGDVWAHPVILDGRLYLRYHDKLHCYDIRAR